MKRILTAGVLFLCVTVFFTGCTSIVIQQEIDPVNVQRSVAEESWAVNEVNEDAPDYYQLNSQVKFLGEEGIEAFKIKDGHSKRTTDMEDFQIVDLLSDKTFIYGYVTQVEGEIDQIVHCGVFYNYSKKEFKVFHEKQFQRTKKEESFHLQMCTSMDGDKGDIFVYDNGQGYLYDKNGILKFQADIESFVQRQYEQAYSISVAQALTDGENRIYIELVIEKEEIIVPEEMIGFEEEKSDKEIEKEAKELDEQEENKMENVVLVYEFHSLNTTLNQENTEFDNQIEEWISMVSDQEFERDNPPDAEADWEDAKEHYPDKWDGVYLDNLDDLPVYEWKNDAQFVNESGVCTFIPLSGQYQKFRDLEENLELQKHFFPLANSYSLLYGKCGELENYGDDTFSRTVVLYWDEDETDDEGNTTSVRKTETKTQELSKNSRFRRAPLQNGYYEVYAILDRKKVVELGDSIGNEIIGVDKKGKAYWVKPDRTYTDAKLTVEENEQVSIFQDGTYMYLFAYDMTTGKIRLIPDTIHKDHTPSSKTNQEFNYKDLPGVAVEGISIEDTSFQNMNENSIPGGLNGYNGGYLTKENILFSSLSLNKSAIEELLEKGSNAVWKELESSKNGYLLTIQNLGVIYYDCSKKRSLSLVDGTWYRSWKIGNQYVSVGFPDTDSFYETKDVAFAKVYEYSLNDIGNKRLEAMLNQMLEEENNTKESSIAQSLEDMTSTEKLEGVEDPMEWWNREYQEKYESLEGYLEE